MVRWCRLAFTIALAAVLPAGASSAQDEDRPFVRPSPSIERQIDRLERGGSVDPATRRRLQDQLRREPRGAERPASERSLERLPAEPPPPAAPLPEPAEPGSLPSSLPPAFGGGGPGVGGHMVPPGGRSGAVR